MALCAIEWPPLQPDTRTEGQKELLEHLVFIGNNGWHDSYAERDAPPMLAELRATGLEQAVIGGIMLGRGASASVIKQQQRLAKKA